MDNNTDSTSFPADVQSQTPESFPAVNPVVVSLETEPNPQNEPDKQDLIRKENSSHWKPGESGNPGGRPKKGYSITEMMRELLDTPVKDEKSGKMILPRKALARSILSSALKGDATSRKLIWQYMDGMPAQTTNLHVAELPKPLLSHISDVHFDNSTPEAPETQE